MDVSPAPSLCFQPHASPRPSSELGGPKPQVPGSLSQRINLGLFPGAGGWDGQLIVQPEVALKLCVQTLSNLSILKPRVNTTFSAPATL